MPLTPYEQGVKARLSGEAEPICPYEPGSQNYSEFAQGFCEAKPLIVPEYYQNGETQNNQIWR